MGNAEKIDAKPCEHCTEPDFGIADFLKAKLSGYARGSTQKARMIMCNLCQECEYIPEEKKIGPKLFKKINGKSFCGDPRVKKLRRDSFLIGCGCHLEDKVRWRASKCPRDLWGPEQENHTGLKGKALIKDGDMQIILPGTPSIPAKFLRIKKAADSILHTIKLVKLEANGIGDICIAAGVIAGLKSKDPNRLIGFGIRGHLGPWANMFSDADYVFANETINDEDFAWTCYPDLGKTDREFPSRGLDPWPNASAEICDCKFKLPNVKIPELDQKWVDEFEFIKPQVMLAPYAMYRYRTWTLNRWIELESKLLGSGYEVHIIDGPGNGERLSMFKGMKHLGLSPGRLMALIKRMNLLIGNDSGPAHLAGVLKIPTIALMGPTRGESIFGMYPNAKWIESPAWCSGCYWQRDAGWRESCAHGCEAMFEITLDSVIEKVEAVINGR